MTGRVIPGYDYRRGRAVEFSRRQWRAIIEELRSCGGRCVRHRRERPGDDDLLLIKNGRIIAEIYEHD